MNYLYFNNGADTSIMYPASALKGIDLQADTAIDFYFKSAHITKVTGTDLEDRIRVTITSDKELVAKEGVVQAVNKALSSSSGFVVIADEANSVFVHENITAIDSILLAV